MTIEELIKQSVHEHYWDRDVNCATTVLDTLAKLFGVQLEGQVLASAAGMHGAGAYGAQCGLVEGALMFAGILGAARNLRRPEIVRLCRELARGFEAVFGSLQCKVLRPQGFGPTVPSHACEELTVRALRFEFEFFRAQIAPLENSVFPHS